MNDQDDLLETRPENPTTTRRRFLKGAALTAFAGMSAGISANVAHAAAPLPPVKGPMPALSSDPKFTMPSYVDANFDDMVKDYDKLTGCLTIYRYKNDLLIEISPDQLDKTYLLQSTRATGTAGLGGTIGDPLGDMAFQFQKQNDQIYLVEPNINFRAFDGSPEEVSIRRSFANAFMTAFPISAVKMSDTDKKKAGDIKDKVAKAAFMDTAAVSYLCPLKTFFLSDITAFVTQMEGYIVDPEKSYVQSVKVFPANLIVESLYAFQGKPSPDALMFGEDATLADDRSIPESVVYNIVPLPDNGYTPRYYDDRIGFFTADYQEFEEDVADDNIRRLIQRWHLVKKDPAAAMSEPVTPITMWIDNGTPVQYRPAIQEGVLSWNNAFEQLGFTNAVVCHIMPDDADWDTADLRYNVVRWMTSPGAGYAVSLMRHNPYTGEIFSTAINIDASMARFTNLDYAYDVSILAGMPQAATAAQPLPTPKDVARNMISPPKKQLSMSRCKCDMGPGARQHASFGWNSIEILGTDGTEVSLEDYTHSYLRQMTAHEMGHCLGLRHNFRASTMLTIKQLQDPNMVSQFGVTASVMDYLPANLAPLGGKQTIYYSSGPGPYDLWAIKYGYSDFGVKLSSLETAKLSQIAEQDRAFGHDFASDEAADSVDPTVVRFDLSSDPLSYRLAMLERGTHMMGLIALKYPASGESYFQLTRKFRSIFNITAQNALGLTSFLGGTITERNHSSDPGAQVPVRPVDSTLQRQALDGICKYVFNESTLNLSPDFLAKLQQDPAPYSDTLEFVFPEPIDFSYLDTLTFYQAIGLYFVMDPMLLSRIETNEFRSPASAKPLSVLETMQTVTNAIWSELGNSNVTVSPLRRRLQRTYVDVMLGIMQTPQYGIDTDSPSFALHSLRTVVAKIDSASPHVTDTTTNVHLSELRTRIARIIHAQTIL